MDVWFGLVMLIGIGGLLIFVWGEVRVLRVRMKSIEDRDVSQWKGQFQTNASVKAVIMRLMDKLEPVPAAVVTDPAPTEPIKENPELEDCHGAD